VSQRIDLLMPRDAQAKIVESPLTHGALGVEHVAAEDVYVVRTVQVFDSTRLPVDIPAEFATLRWNGQTLAGTWVRTAGVDASLLHYAFIHRPGTAIDFAKFRETVAHVPNPGAQTGLVITHSPELPQDLRDAGVTDFAAWLVTREYVIPIQVQLEPSTLGMDQLANLWPIDALKQVSVALVGCGSIGGAAADALAAYGVGTIELIDPDRLLWHNVVRHVLSAADVGALKTSALRERLNRRWPGRRFNAHTLDVVQDAHLVRSIFADSNIVVCTADGVSARRVVSHLARQVSRPALLSAVLDDGAIGELLRLRPTSRFGCLLCFRAALAQQEAIDAESDQELDYGTGSAHKPMTAIPPDLHFMGLLAAKAAVATILESEQGDHTQRLPGEHAVVGLHPKGDLAEPFNSRYAADLQWGSIPPPRPQCPTCSLTAVARRGS
jgi:hypothetical protein